MEGNPTYCIPANDFEDGRLIKSSFITNDKHEASQLRTKFHQKKNTVIPWLWLFQRDGVILQKVAFLN